MANQSPVQRLKRFGVREIILRDAIFYEVAFKDAFEVPADL